jgi:porphobilinogen synthase
MSFPNQRLRRLRQNEKLRQFSKTIHIHYDKLVLPLFIREGKGPKKPIPSMPGHFQLHLDQVEETIQELSELGCKSVILFGIPKAKDETGSSSLDAKGIIQEAIRMIRKLNPQLLIMADTCLCEYTSHGHCGVLEPREDHEDGFCIDNDQSIALIAKQALSFAQAGADIIAPSACMDGMIQAIRQNLDQHGYQNTPILSYAVKYASNMYGPFRQAAEGSPQLGHRKTYQMDYQCARDAILECELDIKEGADMLMVKPGHTYLDIIYQVKQAFPGYMLGAYHTSGEFAMLKAAAEKGWLDEKAAVIEVNSALFRAGADFIISYYTKELLMWKHSN